MNFRSWTEQAWPNKLSGLCSPGNKMSVTLPFSTRKNNSTNKNPAWDAQTTTARATKQQAPYQSSFHDLKKKFQVALLKQTLIHELWNQSDWEKSSSFRMFLFMKTSPFLQGFNLWCKPKTVSESLNNGVGSTLLNLIAGSLSRLKVKLSSVRRSASPIFHQIEGLMSKRVIALPAGSSRRG